MFSMYLVTAHIMPLCVIDLYTGKEEDINSSYSRLLHYICNVYMFREVGMDHILLNKGKFPNYFYVCIYILLIYSIVSYECFCE